LAAVYAVGACVGEGWGCAIIECDEEGAQRLYEEMVGEYMQDREVDCRRLLNECIFLEGMDDWGTFFLDRVRAWG